jgi:POT family proton-dependent oligopeptide transporter
MAAGLFVLLIEDLNWFLVGLALIVAGNGLFKPNISTMVGKLYAPGDIRRDSGFTIFYMGINLGALIAPLVTATWIGATWGLKYGFLAAGIGMILSTLFLEVAKKSLGHIGLPPEGKDGWGRFFAVGGGAIVMSGVVFFLLSESTILGYLLVGIMIALMAYFILAGIRSGDKVQLQRYIAMLILFVANACFWALFEQAGSSMNFFAREFVTPIFGSMETWQAGGFGIFQSLNPLYILLFAPLFAAIWPWLDKRSLNPSIPRKFALGLIQVALGFYLLVFSINNFQNAAGLVPWIFMALVYLLHTTGELCLSPIGLSMVTKLAAEKETGMAMGGWFLSIAMAQYVAGIIAAIASGGSVDHGVATGAGIAQYAEIYMMLFWIGLGFGIAYLVAAPLINKLMHGVK